MESFRIVADRVSQGIDGLGLVVIVIGLMFAFVRFVRPPPPGPSARYHQLRQDLGRGILLGLELMVAADIIRTVAVTPTLQSVFVLGVVVLIRTFLSMSLEVELEGRLPWRKAATDGGNSGSDQAKTRYSA